MSSRKIKAIKYLALVFVAALLWGELDIEKLHDMITEKIYQLQSSSLWHKGIDQDDANAQSDSNGESVGETFKKAINWWRKATNQGNSTAQESPETVDQSVGVVAKGDKETVQDNPPVQESPIVSQDLRVTVKGDKEAVSLWYKEANQGDVKAQFNLGEAYHTGLGVEVDDKEAIKWYRKAADQGHVEAQFNLGLIYYNGYGVEKDDKEAVKWYRRAASQGNAVAQNNLGFCYHNGQGVEKSDKKAFNLWKGAAGQGQADAQDSLANAYHNGWGVEKNDKEAVKWWRQAAAQGNAHAQEMLKRYAK